jgi:transcriptional regulator with XRE-family HTH domain
MNENVKIIRELKNFTQKFMASQLMISQSNYSRMEKGSVNISIDKLEKISSIFEISVSDIINFDETVVKNILKKKKLKDVKS